MKAAELRVKEGVYRVRTRLSGPAYQELGAARLVIARHVVPQGDVVGTCAREKRLL